MTTVSPIPSLRLQLNCDDATLLSGLTAYFNVYGNPGDSLNTCSQAVNLQNMKELHFEEAISYVTEPIPLYKFILKKLRERENRDERKIL